MKTQSGYTAVEVAILLIFLLGAPGWIWNIVKIAHTCCTPIDGMLVLRIIGIFVAPLGAVIGYI